MENLHETSHKIPQKEQKRTDCYVSQHFSIFQHSEHFCCKNFHKNNIKIESNNNKKIQIAQSKFLVNFFLILLIYSQKIICSLIGE